MFDLTSGKLLLLGIVALIVLGPKDFPILLRTIGKYMGILKRQADEFRDQFNDAMRESELEQIKKEVEGLGRDAEASMKETEHAITKDFDTARADLDIHLQDPLKPSPHTDSYTPIDLREPEPAAPTETSAPELHDSASTAAHTEPEAVPGADQNGGPPQPSRSSLNGAGHQADHDAAKGESSPKSGA